MTHTLSEVTFERFCDATGIHWARIPETTTKTPDYTVRLAGQQVIVEVKEMMPTTEEVESDRLVKERGYGIATGGTPGARVRLKIADSSHQIKSDDRTH